MNKSLLSLGYRYLAFIEAGIEVEVTSDKLQIAIDAAREGVLE